MFRHRVCHPQGLFQSKHLQVQEANLPMLRPHWNDYILAL
jgi:hypothetical protein